MYLWFKWLNFVKPFFFFRDLLDKGAFFRYKLYFQLNKICNENTFLQLLFLVVIVKPKSAAMEAISKERSWLSSTWRLLQHLNNLKYGIWNRNMKISRLEELEIYMEYEKWIMKVSTIEEQLEIWNQPDE